MHLSWAVAALIAITGAAGCAPEPAPATAPRFVTLSPPSSTVNVGSTIQLIVSVSGLSSQTVLWTTSNSSAATVSASGLVSCIAPGTATILAIATEDTSLAAASVVACNAASLITVSPASLSFTHIVGTSPCAQAVGSVRVTNISAQSVTVSISSHSALSLDAGSSSFTLGAGAFRDVAISFNCSTQTSFTATLAITATGNGGDVKNVTVIGTIVR